jgi:hypothetical protein
MAAYEVLVDELTLHRNVGEIKDPLTGETVGVQNGRGETYYKGEKVDEADITPDVLNALEDKDHPSHEAVSKRLKKASGDAERDPAVRLGAPFAGYDDMDEDDIVNAMRVLPSAAQMRIKEYEATRDDPRERIVDYNIGFGESNIERQEGKVGGDLVEEGDERDPEAKPSARLKTRTVPDEGRVEPGEGITGTGDPEIAYGSVKDEESGDMKGGGNKGRARAGRRARQPKPSGGTPKDQGGGSLERSNE